MTRFMTATAITALTATAAFAAVDMSDIDTNGDNFASMEEMTSVYPDLDPLFYEDMDMNDDNRISSEELSDAEAQSILARASATEAQVVADADGDGFISYEEMVAAVPGFSQLDFDEIDSNDDNRVSAAELQEPGASRIVSGETAAVTNADHDSLDTDGDNFLSYGELAVGFPDVPQVGFSEIDTNDDNRISSAEFNAPGARTTLQQY